MTPDQRYQQRAEKILLMFNMPTTDAVYADPRNGLPHNLKTDLIAQLREAVEEAEREIATRQALVHGESVMLGGKLVTNEELYKQPIDYIKEAYKEGFAAAREMAKGIAAGMNDGTGSGWNAACDAIADRIAAMEAEEK